MEKIIVRAEEIGAKINCGKTQMIVISPDKGYTSRSTIYIGGGDQLHGLDAPLGRHDWRNGNDGPSDVHPHQVQEEVLVPDSLEKVWNNREPPLQAILPNGQASN